MKAAIYRYIILKIQSGEWALSERIPSEHQLALKFSVTRSLVRKVMTNLCTFKILDNITSPGYLVNANYKTGVLRTIRNAAVNSSKCEWLMTSPFQKKDMDIFKEISKNTDFYSRDFAKVLRVTYFDKDKKPFSVLDSIINHGIVKVFPSEHLDLQTYKLFAANGQPVVNQEQVAVQFDDTNDVFSKYKLPQKHLLATYISYFNFDNQLLALSRLVMLNEDAKIETVNLDLVI